VGFHKLLILHEIPRKERRKERKKERKKKTKEREEERQNTSMVYLIVLGIEFTSREYEGFAWSRRSDAWWRVNDRY